ncbi:MAG: hypothetical protein H0V89_04650 [Deltaproteobacteria bacterium]|nr:hypothetical protein [Deltaproteobacteria bacterium]
MWFLATAALAVIPAKEDPREFELGAGAFFDAGGEFMTQPDDNIDGQPGLPYNGFAGFSPGGGIGIDFRYRGIIGLELDFVRRTQVAKSEFTIDGTTFPWSIRQSATQIPVLVKLTAPVGLVRPNLFGGIEAVIPGDTSVVDPEWNVDVDLTADAGTWMYVTFGLGFEFALPIEEHDLRIPLNIRLSTNPSLPESAFERATYDVENGVLEGVDYVSEWQYQAAVTLGLFYHFL